jgi:hypothetical protein
MGLTPGFIPDSDKRFLFTSQRSDRYCGPLSLQPNEYMEIFSCDSKTVGVC